jgi:hypothetical protein
MEVCDMSDKELKFARTDSELPLETVLNPGMIVFKNEGNPFYKPPTADASPPTEESQVF